MEVNPGYLARRRNIPGARSKLSSNMVETHLEAYLEHGRNIPRARSKHTSRAVKTYLALGRIMSIKTLFQLKLRTSIPKIEKAAQKQLIST